MHLKLTYFLSNRASYYRSQVLLDKLNRSTQIDLELIITSSLASKDFQNVRHEIYRRFDKVTEFPLRMYDGTPHGMAQTSFELGKDLSIHLKNNKPDMAICYADRFELLPFALTCSYMNIPLCQIQAGEDSGNIDQKVRHAVTALSDMHFVSHRPAFKKLTKMGYKNVHLTGCPSIDLIKDHGIKKFKSEEPYIICIFHAHTDEFHVVDIQAQAVLQSVQKFCREDGMLCYYFYSNNDPGFREINKVIESEKSFKPVLNIEGKQFLKLLAGASAIVGNSSSGLRESSYLGIPSINIGERQRNRVKSKNVFDCGFGDILPTIRQAIKKEFKQDDLFGSGDASEKIIGRLMEWKNKNSMLENLVLKY